MHADMDDSERLSAAHHCAETLWASSKYSFNLIHSDICSARKPISVNI